MLNEWQDNQKNTDQENLGLLIETVAKLRKITSEHE